MKNNFLLVAIALLVVKCLVAQNDSIYKDNKYLEDQIYLGLTYDVLRNKPTDFNQNGFSGGLTAGFIKDIPLNKERNIAIGIGVGYAYNAFIQNLLISDTSPTTYQIVGSDSYKTNRFLTHSIEVPIEFRWRTSSSKDYKFWRIYGGAKIGYVFDNRSKYSGDLGLLKNIGMQDFQKLQYGLILSTGYNTLNLHVYYGLNSLFNNAVLDGKKLDLKQLNVGFIFYIL